MAVTPLPPPPSRSDPGNFPARADTFLGALPLFGAELNDTADEVNADAAAAAASAASALNAPGTSATSATQLTISAGAKTLAIQAGKAFAVGQFVTIAQTSAPGNWMVGGISAHDPQAGSLTVQVIGAAGAGAQASDWTVGLSSPMQFFPATAADIWAGQDATRPATAASLMAAAAMQALTDAATITPDFATGLNFSLTLAGNRTLANPANSQACDNGLIALTQDNVGGRALAVGSAWKFPGGPPVLSVAAGAVDVISYFVITPGLIACTLVRGLA